MIIDLPNNHDLIILSSIFVIILFLKYLHSLIVSDVNYSRDMSCPKKSHSFYRSDLPPVYPNGWIPVASSTSINNTQVYESIICGNEIILFRDQNSNIICFDAYCPHLGANLAYGGTLLKLDNHSCAIRCPFHGWLFNTKGDCIDIPYGCSKETKAASIRTYKVIELNNFVYVWYHADNEEPNYFPEPVDEVVKNEWKYLGRTEHITSCHYQEIPENGADIGHLNTLHRRSIVNGSDLINNQKWFHNLIDKINYHEWRAEYDLTENELNRKLTKVMDGTKKSNDKLTAHNENTEEVKKSYVTMIFLQKKTLFFTFNVFEMNLGIKQLGPSMVYLNIKAKLFNYFPVNAMFIQSIQPLEPFKHKIIHHLFSKDCFFDRIMSKLFLYGEATMLERDVLIWNHKKFLKKAFLLKNERSIVKFRKWFQQFYSPSSPTVESLRNDLNW